jgi:hypothetical protein
MPANDTTGSIMGVTVEHSGRLRFDIAAAGRCLDTDTPPRSYVIAVPGGAGSSRSPSWSGSTPRRLWSRRTGRRPRCRT